MNLDTILQKHFTPAGVLGGTGSRALERDLRRHARLNATIYAGLLVVLLAILCALAIVVYTDARDGQNVRISLLAGAGVTVPVVLEWIRRTVREWSQANLMTLLARKLEGPQLQSVMGKLIDANNQVR